MSNLKGQAKRKAAVDEFDGISNEAMLQSVPVQFGGLKKMDTRVEINTWTTTKTIVAGMELLASKSQHQFDAQQLKALKYVCQVCQGENVFINGIGGTGKSTVLKEIMSEHGSVCRGMTVTPTGITAFGAPCSIDS